MLVDRVVVIAAAYEGEVHAVDAAAVARHDAPDVGFRDESFEPVVCHCASPVAFGVGKR